MYTIITTNKAKCENCKKEHDYAIKNAVRTGFAGTQYQAICPKCQNIMIITDNFDFQSCLKLCGKLEPIEVPNKVIFEAC